MPRRLTPETLAAVKARFEADGDFEHVRCINAVLDYVSTLEKELAIADAMVAAARGYFDMGHDDSALVRAVNNYLARRNSKERVPRRRKSANLLIEHGHVATVLYRLPFDDDSILIECGIDIDGKPSLRVPLKHRGMLQWADDVVQHKGGGGNG